MSGVVINSGLPDWAPAIIAHPGVYPLAIIVAGILVGRVVPLFAREVVRYVRTQRRHARLLAARQRATHVAVPRTLAGTYALAMALDEPDHDPDELPLRERL